MLIPSLRRSASRRAFGRSASFPPDWPAGLRGPRAAERPKTRRDAERRDEGSLSPPLPSWERGPGVRGPIMAERFFHDGPLAVGPVTLAAPEAHHLAAVTRHRPGDVVRLF